MQKFDVPQYDFSDESPEGGVFSGVGVVGNQFDTDGLDNNDYIITYTYTDPITNCTHFCEFTVSVDIDVNISSHQLGSLSIYPNPGQGIINISGLSDQIIYDIILTDITGKTIIKCNIRNNEFVDVSQFSKGVYLLNIYGVDAYGVFKYTLE